MALLRLEPISNRIIQISGVGNDVLVSCLVYSSCLVRSVYFSFMDCQLPVSLIHFFKHFILHSYSWMNWQRLMPLPVHTFKTNCLHTKLDRFHMVLNPAVRAITKTWKIHHIYLHIINLCIDWKYFSAIRAYYKITSIIYYFILSIKPIPISVSFSVQSTSTICSSAVFILRQPYNPSRLK